MVLGCNGSGGMFWFYKDHLTGYLWQGVAAPLLAYSTNLLQPRGNIADYNGLKTNRLTPTYSRVYH